MAKLWGGRFSAESSQLLEEFNASINFDKNLWREDIKGSKAHADMLESIGVLTADENAKIQRGLDEIATQIEQGVFEFKIADEDIHMAVESALTALIGEVGKKLHTGRSRNDQVALDFRLWTLRENREIQGLILDLLEVLANLADTHKSTLMPGMTHLQHAQVVTLGFHLMAWAQGFLRDLFRFQDCYTRNNFCPLGSGALAGTPYGNDRAAVADALGFIAPTANAMDSVAERDFALDLSYAIAMVMLHISRVAEELILWNTSEFGFVVLSDAYATGSSIMPQKKNPDIPELLRGKTGRVYGNLIALLTTMKALPFAYNKDMQEDKEGVFDSVKTAKNCLAILKECLKSCEFSAENMRRAALKGHLCATDFADFLVRECGVAFRDAHHIVGRAVALAESRGVDVSELDESELLALDSRVKKGVKAVLDLSASVASKSTLGGTASERVSEQILALREGIKQGLAWLAE